MCEMKICNYLGEDEHFLDASPPSDFELLGKKRTMDCLGFRAHVEGEQSRAYGEASHAEGYGTVVRGDCGHGEGSKTQANGLHSHSEGSETQANGHDSHAEGFQTFANGFASHAGGCHTIAQNDCSTAIGRYNANQMPVDAFIIGNGSEDVRSNAFRVTFHGDVYGASAFHSGGLDHAEMYEWLDGNPDGEDRVGYFVTLEGKQIRKVSGFQDYVLGIVSATPAFVGNAQDAHWHGMLLQDEWGRTLCDPQGMPIINPDYDASKLYLPRRKRPEWAAVGVMGQLLVRDDGSCKVNGRCLPDEDGVATCSENGYFVMERLADNQILIMLK